MEMHPWNGPRWTFSPMLRMWGLGLLLLVPCFCSTRAAMAQPATEPATTEPAKPETITREEIEKRRKQAEESKDLDDETKKNIAELYQQALDALTRADEYRTKAATFKTAAENVQQRVQQLKSQIENLKFQPTLGPPEDAELADLEQELSQKERQLTELRAAQAKAEAESARRAERRKEIRSFLFSAPERLAQVKQQLQTPPPANEPPMLTQARRAEQEARLRAIEQEIPALQNELALYDAEEAVDLVRLDRDLKTQMAAMAEKEVRLLEELVKQKRADAARAALRKAQEEAVEAQPALQPFADENRAIAEKLQELTEPIEEVELALNGPNGAKKLLEDLRKQFEQTKKKVDTVGLTSAIGSLLRRQQAALPDQRRYELNVANRREVIDEVQFDLLKYDDLRTELSNPDRVAEEIVAEVGRGLDDAERDRLKASAQYLLQRRGEYLNTLLRSYNAYFDSLVELDNTEQQLIKLIDEYVHYINERVLWIRSDKHLRLSAVMTEEESLGWLFSGGHWAEVVERLWIDMQEAIVLFAAALIVFGGLFYLRLRFRREIRAIGHEARRSSCTEFGPTLRVVLLTLVIACLWPGVAAYLGWRLSLTANDYEFAKAVAQALLDVAVVYFPLEFFRQVCRPHGLGEAHFEWPERALRCLRANLRWLMCLGLPLLFVTRTLGANEADQPHDSLERLGFILGMVCVSGFLWRVVHPRWGVFTEYVAYHRGGWVDRLKYVWYWLGVFSPLVLAALAYVGYFYTARQLAWRLHSTGWLLVGLLLFHDLLLRWLLLNRRRLSIQQAQERRAAAAETAAQDGTPAQPSLGPAHIQARDKQEIDLSTLSAQVDRLLNTALFVTAFVGLWLIWVEVLPALGFLDRWTLWTTTVKVSAPAADADAETAPALIEKVEDVTLADLVFATLIAVVTVIAARNIPGLLEMCVLQRLPLEASVRYAVTTLVSYGIVLLGVVMAAGAVGLSWSQIQWLATALTFGLAFGLQEIFANFVSGLIILFERPIRVGDIVTVDDVSGVISRVRIRATTITNWDRKEYVIPNKEFIIGRILNWTLSDKVNRIVIEVGIAYGSDTEKARELLLKVCQDHPLILKEPPTMVTFEGFGDNSLNFVVRTFLPSLDNRLLTIHELHTGIDQAFRKAGIEISFPQRDLHLRSVDDGVRDALRREEHESLV